MKKNYKSAVKLRNKYVKTSVRFEKERWHEVDLKKIFESSLFLALEELNYPVNFYSASIFACGLDTIKNLNREFLKKDKSTNVLSWPQLIYEKKSGSDFPNIPEEFFGCRREIFLGDIAISYDYCKDESVRLEVQFFEHCYRLATHSILHLLGFDHQEDKDAKIMEGLEMNLLSRIFLECSHNGNVRFN